MAGRIKHLAGRIGGAFQKDIDPNSAWITVIGLLFWAVLIAGACCLHGYVSEMLEVDRCLDAGGAYDYQAEECVYR
jgi:hypothetical protein